MGLVIITVNVELMTDAYKVFSITPDLLSGQEKCARCPVYVRLSYLWISLSANMALQRLQSCIWFIPGWDIWL